MAEEVLRIRVFMEKAFVKDETEKQLDYDIMCYVAIGIAIQQYPAESKHDEHRPQTVKPQPGYFHVFGRSIVCITPLPV